MKHDPTHNYTIRACFVADIPVRAGSVNDAIEKIRAMLEESTANLGMIDGEPVVVECKMLNPRNHGRVAYALEIDGVEQ